MRRYKVAVRRTTFEECEIEVEAKSYDHAMDVAPTAVLFPELVAAKSDEVAK